MMRRNPGVVETGIRSRRGFRGGVVGLAIAATTLAACGSGASGDSRSAAATTGAAADVSPSAPLAPQQPTPPTAPSGNLSGDVSGLDGVVSPFTVQVTDTSTIVSMAADTLFAFNSAALSAEAQTSLNRVAELIRRGGNGTIEVAGHTDGVGSDQFNIDLSRRRAEAVRDWLVAQNVAPSGRFTINAAGKSQPKAPNTNPDGSDNPAGRAQNRRVEVVIPK